MASPMTHPKRTEFIQLLGPVVLLLVFFGSRLPSLTLMPLHFDEQIHLTGALAVWQGHPFWNIGDGRIANLWAIALLYPQHAPIFVGRLATILVVLPGIASGYALIARWFGHRGSLIATVLWIACPYLFFYERTALVDAEVGAWTVVAIWASVRLAATGKRRDALLAGLVLAVTILFKFSAAPVAVSVAVIVLLLGKAAWRTRFENLALIGLVVLACFALPLAYALTRQTQFSIINAWLVGSGGHGLTLDFNLRMLWAQLVDYGTVVWSVLFGMGLLAIVIGLLSPSLPGRRDLVILLAACAIPFASILVFVANAMPRHLVVGVPILLILAGGGLGSLIDRVSRRFPRSGRLGGAASGVVAALLVIGIAPFARTAYTAPGELPLPPIARGQYLTGYSAGFGLREAVLDFPNTIGEVGTPIVASMYPDGCRLANFYDRWGYGMLCDRAQGVDLIPQVLASQPDGGVVYVLAEPPPIGLDPAWMSALPDVSVSRVRGYPRPGETPQTASVVLWRIEKLSPAP